MKKGVIIGIIVLLIIGVAFASVQLDSDEPEQIEVTSGNEGEPKRYTVGLSENMGMTEP